MNNDSLVMDLEFGPDRSIDPIILQDDSLIMSGLGGRNLNHEVSTTDSILSNPQLKVG